MQDHLAMSDKVTKLNQTNENNTATMSSKGKACPKFVWKGFSKCVLFVQLSEYKWMPIEVLIKGFESNDFEKII